MNSGVDILAEYSAWTPAQKEFFVAIMQKAIKLHNKGTSETQVLKALRRFVKAWEKKSAK